MKIIILILFVIFIIENQCHAQLIDNTSTSGNNYSQTNPANNIESIGIGDFGGIPTDPWSALHINTNLFGALANLHFTCFHLEPELLLL